MRSPFGEGKKRKEFPDAFALAALDVYAQKVPDGCIAVVSADADFKVACARYPSLMYFQSLPRLTELLLGDDANIEEMRAIVDEDIDTLTNEIDDIMPGLRFYPADKQYEITRTKYEGCSIEDLHIVAVGDGECTVTFGCEIEAQHNMMWMDWDYRGSSEEPQPWQRDEWVTQRTGISGTAKVAIDRVRRAIKEITWLELDSGEIEVLETPRRY